MQDTVRRWTNFHILGPDRNLVQKALEDDNDTRISGTRRADVIGVGEWLPSCRGFGIAKILKKRQLHPRQGFHPVDVGSKSSVAGEKGS
jgi:hypothetical protein